MIARQKIEYVIGRKGPTTYTVSKFQGDDEPLEVYEVDHSTLYRGTRNQPLARCSCMAYRSGKSRPCKHIDMVSLYANKAIRIIEEIMAEGKTPPQPFAFTSFVCEGVGTEWRFVRCEPEPRR